MLSEDKLDKLTKDEDMAYFRAELCLYTPESYSLEEKAQICNNMIASSVAIEDAMRDEFAELGEVEQTMLLDMLGKSGYKDRDWWRLMLMDGPRRRAFPTN